MFDGVPGHFKAFESVSEGFEEVLGGYKGCWWVSSMTVLGIPLEAFFLIYIFAYFNYNANSTLTFRSVLRRFNVFEVISKGFLSDLQQEFHNRFLAFQGVSGRYRMFQRSITWVHRLSS